MGAFGAVSLAFAEKKVKNNAVYTKENTVYQRTFTFQTQASDTVAGPIDINVTNAAGTVTPLTLPVGTQVLGIVVKPTKTIDGTVLSAGTSTLALNTKTSAVTFMAATAFIAEAAGPVSVGVAVPSTASVPDVVQASIAAATLPAFAMTWYVTLTLTSFGLEVPTFTGVGN